MKLNVLLWRIACCCLAVSASGKPTDEQIKNYKETIKHFGKRHEAAKRQWYEDSEENRKLISDTAKILDVIRYRLNKREEAAEYLKDINTLRKRIQDLISAQPILEDDFPSYGY
ncbi:uncharacterized protein [Apostichopus japonicus]|uniref:uncharacterized protein n=1 Tax=Stichopus japonicus TaxID=307972 RepID=UPI003AB898C1